MSEQFTVNYQALGVKIRQKRKLLELTQEKASEHLGLSESFYSRVERGDRVLSVETLVKIANYYDLSIDYLLLDSKHSGTDDKLSSELDNIFRDKSPTQSDYLLNLLNVLSKNIDELAQ